MLWVLMVLCACAGTGVRAQGTLKRSIDSAINLLAVERSDTVRLRLYHYLAATYPNYDPNKGLESSGAELALARRLAWPSAVVYAQIDFGLNYNSMPDYGKARYYFEQALATANDIGNRKLKVLATKYIGITYYTENNNPEALKYLFDALQLAEEAPVSKELFDLLEWVGRVYESQKLYTKALEYYTRSYDKAVSAGAQNAGAKNMMNIGQVYQQMGRNEEALAIFSKGLAAFQTLGDQNGIAVITADMGAVFTELQRYGEALAKWQEALAYYTATGDRMNMANVMEGMGKNYISIAAGSLPASVPDSLRNKILNEEKGFYYLNKAIEICKDISYFEGLQSAYNNISVAYMQKGDYKSSLANYKASISLRDSVYSIENGVKIANLEMHKAVELKDKQLEINELLLEKKKGQSAFFIMGIALLLLVTVILYRNFSTQKKLNSTISDMVEKQGKMIDERTLALMAANRKLLDLIQFNVHHLREPITRISGLMILQKEIDKEEFIDVCLPMLESSVNDLDATLKKVIQAAEETKNNPL
ncbi:MAG: tetratricopeptide repeat protein [Taibaiella sp.]|nr:tetratricopeptide repeat protein [Taibaiella sp.]